MESSQFLPCSRPSKSASYVSNPRRAPRPRKAIHELLDTSTCLFAAAMLGRHHALPIRSFTRSSARLRQRSLVGASSKCSRYLSTLPLRPPTCAQYYAHKSSYALARDSRRLLDTGYHSRTPERLSQSRRLYSTETEKPQQIAVLGGGITGLATTYYLAKELPNAHITLFDSNSELGGWIRSKSWDVGDGDEVVFESGPRSLRPQAPNGTLVLKLVQDIGLANDLLFTSKSSPAARNRFVYYPDHLVHMPGPGQRPTDALWTVLREPIFKGLFRGIFKDISSDERPDSLKDESVGSFLARRGSEAIANNLASAVFHGIYAGDIWNLSIKSVLPGMWANEAKFGDLTSAGIMGAFRGTHWGFCDDIHLQNSLGTFDWDPELRENIADCSVFTFKKGVQMLADRLAFLLLGEGMKDRVTVRLGTDIWGINSKTSQTMTLHLRNPETTTEDMDPIKSDTLRRDLISQLRKEPKDSDKQPGTALTTPVDYNTVISTMSQPTLNELLDRASSDSRLQFSSSAPNPSDRTPPTQAVTVMVVNLYFRTPSLLTTLSPPGGLPPTLGPSGLRGFGYLIPQSVPLSQNPERALGVIFDSDISPDLHTTFAQDRLGTRLTVMLGGHWWNGWKHFPTDSEGLEMALDVLARHLGITEPPQSHLVTLQPNCIPQYAVGHTERMAHWHTKYLEAFAGKLKVAGSWYTGVGVNDCIRGAFDVVQGIKDAAAENPGKLRPTQRTGLEGFATGRPMCKIVRKKGEVEVVEVEENARRMGYFPGVPVERKDSSTPSERS